MKKKILATLLAVTMLVTIALPSVTAATVSGGMMYPIVIENATGAVGSTGAFDAAVTATPGYGTATNIVVDMSGSAITSNDQTILNNYVPRDTTMLTQFSIRSRATINGSANTDITTIGNGKMRVKITLPYYQYNNQGGYYPPNGYIPPNGGYYPPYGYNPPSGNYPNYGYGYAPYFGVLQTSAYMGNYVNTLYDLDTDPTTFTFETNMCTASYALIIYDSNAQVPQGNKVKIQFSTSGGSSIDEISVDYNGSIDPYAFVPKKTGYAFGGWYYDSALTRQVQIGDKFTANTILYIKWLDEGATTPTTPTPPTTPTTPPTTNTPATSNPQTGDTWFANLFA